jgi:hypothetical protein
MVRAAVIALALLVVSIPRAAAQDEGDMQILASAATKVAAKLDAYVMLHADASKMTEKDLVIRLREGDPGLLSEFDDFALRPRVAGENSSILVCDKEADRALLEDAGCSAISDLHLWKESKPCDFQLDLEAVCRGQ